ncbi:MAG: tripartite tricarboxylate transporter substrate-binding protein, partial [Betaproteobacteria bacterium]
MDRSLRRLLRALAALPAAAAAPRLRAQGRTVRLLVGFPPGGGTDAIARVLADKLKDELSAGVVVDNRAGAGGQIAAQELKRAVPDGNTLFLSHDHTISILPLVLRNAGFEPARDFVPVAGIATFVNAFAVSGGTAARSFNDYVAWVKAQGGKSTVGIPAPASVPQFLVLVIGAPVFTYHVHTEGAVLPPGASLWLLTDDEHAAARALAGRALRCSARAGIEALRASLPVLQRPPGRGRVPAPAPLVEERPNGAVLMAALRRTLPPGALVVEEAPTHRGVLREHFPITRSGGFFAAASGGLGWALPAAVGVALGSPGAPVLC